METSPTIESSPSKARQLPSILQPFFHRGTCAWSNKSVSGIWSPTPIRGWMFLTHTSPRQKLPLLSSLCINMDSIIMAITTAGNLLPILHLFLIKFIRIINDSKGGCWFNATHVHMPQSICIATLLLRNTFIMLLTLPPTLAMWMFWQKTVISQNSTPSLWFMPSPWWEHSRIISYRTSPLGHPTLPWLPPSKPSPWILGTRLTPVTTLALMHCLELTILDLKLITSTNQQHISCWYLIWHLFGR